MAPADAATVGVTVAGGNGPGSAANQLLFPAGLAQDGLGNIFVADTWNSRVQRWAPGATSGVTVAGGNGPGSTANQLSSPSGVAVADDGNIFVADTGNDRVQRWAPGATSGVTVAGGEFGNRSDQLAHPMGVAVGAGGNLYVGDTWNNRVQLWAPGAYVGVTVAHDLLYPEGVAVDGNGSVYVADTQNNRVQLWTPGATSGVTVAGGNGPGSAANQLLYPEGVAVDGNGSVYVADTWNNRVQLWTAGQPTVLPGTGSVLEGDHGTTALEVPVSLSNPWTQTVTVQWTTLVASGAPGSQADPATDYVRASGTVTFAPGETSKSVTLALDGDSLVEPDEYIVVSFHDPTNAAMGGFWGLGFGVIVNDDHAVVLPDSASALEGNSATTALQVPVTLSNPSTQTITVAWRTLFAAGATGSQADPATDYTPSSGTVTFAPGQTTGTVTILVNGDTLVEPDEYIVVSFHDPTNAVMGGFWGLGFGVITNDD